MKMISKKQIFAVGLLLFGCALFVIVLSHKTQTIHNVRSYPKGFIKAIEEQKILQTTIMGFSLMFFLFGSLMIIIDLVRARWR